MLLKTIQMIVNFIDFFEFKKYKLTSWIWILDGQL